MEELKEKLGIPKYPDMIREEDVNQIVKWAQKEANPVYPVPGDLGCAGDERVCSGHDGRCET